MSERIDDRCLPNYKGQYFNSQMSLSRYLDSRITNKCNILFGELLPMSRFEMIDVALQ